MSAKQSFFVTGFKQDDLIEKQVGIWYMHALSHLYVLVNLLKLAFLLTDESCCVTSSEACQQEFVSEYILFNYF